MKKQLIAAAAAVTGLTFAVAPTVDARPTAPEPNIVDVAVEVNDSVVPGAFDTLIKAVAVCEPGIASVLSQRGQYTVFAPTDEAFANIGVTEANVCDVPGLADILTYHVANGNRDSSQVLESSTIKMLNGDRVAVDAANLRINDSALVLPYIDVAASNGIIHVIGDVLIPPAD